MSTVRFSIVIPTRHRNEDLARCLELLRPQVAAEGAEVIVTDDGAESTAERMIADRFAFARWTAGPRRGPAANRNHGARMAQGDLILFLDDDVIPSAELLQGYRAALTDDVNVYEGRTTCLAGLHSPLEQSPINDKGDCLWSCNLALRRTAWDKVGGFDEDFPYPHLEDVVLRDRLKALGERWVFVPNAAVDHPPRRLPPPRKLALFHESYVLYHYKYSARRPSKRGFFVHFFRHRAYTIARFPLGKDSLTALTEMLVEGGTTFRHWNAWDAKWRQRYPNAGS